MARLINTTNPYNQADRQLFNDVTGDIWQQFNTQGCKPYPTIAVLNGVETLRKDWHKTLDDDDLLVLVRLPANDGGDGGSNPVRLVAMLAISMYAPYLATSMGVAGAATAATFGFQAATMGITMAGMALVNAVLPPPKPSVQQLNYDNTQASPTYSLQAQGNQARLNQAIPVIYGRMRVFPDFANQPYVQYDSINQQKLTQIFCIGQGDYELSDFKFGDTPAFNFKQVTIEVFHANADYQPDWRYTADMISSEDFGYGSKLNHWNSFAKVNSFGQVSSPDVSGQKIVEHSEEFLKVKVNKKSKYGEFDIVAPQGIYTVDDNGNPSSNTVYVTIHWQADGEAEKTARVPLYIPSVTPAIAANTPMRWTKTLQLDEWQADVNDYYQKEYTVWITRDAPSTNNRTQDALHWQAYRASTNLYVANSKCTYVKVEALAGESLGAKSSRRFNCIATAKTKKLDSNLNWVDGGTSNPVYGSVDILKNNLFGAKLDDNRFNLAQIKQLADEADANAEEFNAVFDSSSNLAKALENATRCCRSSAIWQGGKLNIIRDKPQTHAVAMFGMNNIIKDSFKLSYLLPNETTADAVNLGYLDDTDWSNKRIIQKENQEITKEERVEFFGCTKTAQAQAEADYLLKTNKYRRQFVSFDTELEGYIPSFGDLILVAHELPRWATSGEVLNYDASTKIMTLSQSVTFKTGDHYVVLRNNKGEPENEIKATYVSDTQVQLSTDPTVDLTDDQERVLFAFGDVETIKQRVLVTSIKPRSLNRISISGVVDDERVFG